MLSGGAFVERAILVMAIIMLIILIVIVFLGSQRVKDEFDKSNKRLAAIFSRTQDELDAANRSLRGQFGQVPGIVSSNFGTIEAQVAAFETDFNNQLDNSAAVTDAALSATAVLVPDATNTQLDLIATTVEASASELFDNLFGSGGSDRLDALIDQIVKLGGDLIKALIA